MTQYRKNSIGSRNRPGIVLLITLVILAVLSMLGYTLSSRVMAQRLRDQYLIDYSKARYGCDSALKYSLANMGQINPVLVSRPNEPDFSDLFALDAAHYQELLDMWKFSYQTDNTKQNAISNTGSESDNANSTDANDLENITISGPYGATWPLIEEPVEIEIGDVKVHIEIEDENAKYPLGWAMMQDEQSQREIDAGFETFCQMSGLNSEQIDAVRADLKEISHRMPFKITFEPVVTTTRQPVRTTSTSRGTTSRTSPAPQVKRTVLTTSIQITNQTNTIAKLFNCNLLDREALAKPTIIDENRKESPLKYISTWGTRAVNVNSAPRQVLEAAFIFGGNQVAIADQIIQLRKIQPFESIEDLEKRVTGYTDSIEKCKPYITTTSRIFTIKITATSGLAKASAVIAVSKDGNTVKRIFVINS
jgi:DNA uptake protein ComE-like DNA-binding protein